MHRREALPPFNAETVIGKTSDTPKSKIQAKTALKPPNSRTPASLVEGYHLPKARSSLIEQTLRNKLLSLGSSSNGGL